MECETEEWEWNETKEWEWDVRTVVATLGLSTAHRSLCGSKREGVFRQEARLCEGCLV